MAPVELKMVVVLRLGVVSVLVTSMSAWMSTLMSTLTEASAARSCASVRTTTTDAGVVVVEMVVGETVGAAVVGDDDVVGVVGAAHSPQEVAVAFVVYPRLPSGRPLWLLQSGR